MLFIGEIAGLSAAGLWSFSSIVFTTVTKRIGAVQLNIDRMVLATIFLILTIALLGIGWEVSLNQIILLSISGFIGLIIGDTFLFKAYQEAGPRLSSMLMTINPAIAAVLAMLFLGESLSLWGFLGIAVTIGGVMMVLSESRQNAKTKFKITKAGIIYGLLAATGQAVGLIFAKQAYLNGEIHSLTATLIRIAAAAIVMIIIMTAMKKYKNPVKLYKDDTKSFSLVALGSVIGPYLGIWTSFIAITNTKISIASTLMSVVPIYMLPLSKIVYKEKLTAKSILGAFAAVAGIAVLFLK